jgi:glycosyltransferase involved in cell wall biosynthesis
MPCVLFHAADQDPATTSSLGILNYSRRLIQEFAVRPDPGFRLILLVAQGNRHLFVPAGLPSWISVDELPGLPRGTGWRRLWCDHVGVLRSARRHGARLVHFPKGWVPVLKPPGLRFLATLHDAIPEYCAVHHPGGTSRLKRAYFAWALRHSLDKADLVVTDSNASRDHLVSIAPESGSKMRTVWLGPGISIASGSADRDSMLVLGSRQPHKAIARTLRMLSTWMARTPGAPALRITGLTGWPAEWGSAPDLPGAVWLGRIPDDHLAREYARAKALVLLSEIEGFGLPALEAVMSGAAVCYRNVSSVGELMQGAPGAWDGRDEEGFYRALHEALRAPPEAWSAVRDRLARDARWDQTAATMLGLYAKMLG